MQLALAVEPAVVFSLVMHSQNPPSAAATDVKEERNSHELQNRFHLL